MKTPKCPIVFSSEDFVGLTAHGFTRTDAMIAATQANTLAAAQWQAYVEGLTEVFSSEDKADVWCNEKYEADTHVARLMGVEEIGK